MIFNNNFRPIANLLLSVAVNGFGKLVNIFNAVTTEISRLNFWITLQGCTCSLLEEFCRGKVCPSQGPLSVKRSQSLASKI